VTVDAEGAGVIPRTVLSAELLALAGRQARTLSREQFVGFGVSDRALQRMLSDGTVERICRGVYATGEGGWLQQAWAGVLIGGPQAVLGGHAAAYLHGLITEAPAQILVFGPRWRQRDPRWRPVRAPRLGSGEPPRTRLAQTVVDVTAELDSDDMIAVVAEAIGRRRLRPAEVRQVLAATARHPHRKLLEDLVGEVAAGARSPLEVRYARDVEGAHGLPVAVRQAGPLARYQTDAWYAEYGVLVELDGRAYHRGQAALDDMDRDNDHQLLGITTFRFGWRQVARPCRVAAIVARALRERGWSGIPRTCWRCHAPL